MVDCALDLLVGSEPPARTDVQGGHLFRGPARLEPVTEKIPEEVVVAEPLALLVQGDHEEVGFLQPFQRRLSLHDLQRHLARDRPTQRRAEAFQDGRGLKVLLQRGIQASQQLLQEVVGDVAIAARKLADALLHVRAAPKRQCGQMQTGDPSLRSLQE